MSPIWRILSLAAFPLGAILTIVVYEGTVWLIHTIRDRRREYKRILKYWGPEEAERQRRFW